MEEFLSSPWLYLVLFLLSEGIEASPLKSNSVSKVLMDLASKAKGMLFPKRK